MVSHVMPFMTNSRHRVFTAIATSIHSAASFQATNQGLPSSSGADKLLVAESIACNIPYLQIYSNPDTTTFDSISNILSAEIL